jgi:hypothetical protein
MLNPYVEILSRALYNKVESFLYLAEDIEDVKIAIEFMNSRTFSARFEMSSLYVLIRYIN